MKKLVISLWLISSLASVLYAATTINAANKHAYGANIGWLNTRGDVTSGAVIGEFVCSGSIWSANVGWIHLGSGAPTNGIQYLNVSSNDFGVNHDGLGNLRGFAYGANIGWLNFETTGAPKVDLKTGNLLGSVWSANCGWISLSNAFAHVQTDVIAPGAVGTNGLPLAWMLTYYGTTNVNANADTDGDGMTAAQEYGAGTNPTNSSDYLAITAVATTPGGTAPTVTWKSTLTRCYYLEKTLGLSPATWLDSGLGQIAPDGVSTTRMFGDTAAPVRFYRIRAVKPLSP